MNWRWLIWDFADRELPLNFRQRMAIAWRRIPKKEIPKGALRQRFIWAFSIMVATQVPLQMATLFYDFGYFLFVPLIIGFLPASWIFMCVHTVFFVEKKFTTESEWKGSTSVQSVATG